MQCIRMCCISVHQAGGEGDVQADDQPDNIRLVIGDTGSNVICCQLPPTTQQVLTHLNVSTFVLPSISMNLIDSAESCWLVV